MVNELNILSFLDSSRVISEAEKITLTEWKNSFPWSEPVQVAYLKALKDTNDIRFSNELERIALTSSNRKALYHLLYDQDLQRTIDKVEEEIESLIDEVIIPAWETAKSNLEIEEDIEDADVPELSLLEPDEVKIVEEHPNIETKDLNEHQTSSNSDLPDSKLNFQLISEAVEFTISKEVQEDIDSQKAEEEVQEEEELQITSPNRVSSDDFISWLVENATAVNYPSFNTHSENNLSSKRTVDQLIDKFITEDPKITPGKAREYGIEDVAKQSLVDNEEFVTETLAEIYASQGNFSKAKKAFQLLSLKYPEKSIYFAARIKQLGRKK